MTLSLSRIRVLPLTIFVAFLLLSVKIGGVWQGIDGMIDSIGVTTAQARPAQAQETAPTTEPAAPTATKMASTDAAPANAETTAEPPLMPRDPALFTQSEIELLQQLADRREKLEQRSRELDMRQGLLSAAERRIEMKVEELRALKTTIEALVQTHEDQQDGKLTSLVKIYENMKPKDAARIFEELDMDTLLMVAERMKERSLAPIMANMDPGKAKEMTVELARSREIPIPDNPLISRGG